jgi:cytochrome c-type biogenesis protein CcmH
MKRWLVALVLCAITSVATAIDTESFEDPALQERYRNLTHLLRCPKCQNETIAESPAGVAIDLRREVRRMLLEGHTDQEILNFMSERFGDFVLYKPPFTARTFILWFAPALLLAGGLVTVAMVIRKRSKQSFDDTPLIDAADADRVRKEVDAS